MQMSFICVIIETNHTKALSSEERRQLYNLKSNINIIKKYILRQTINKLFTKQPEVNMKKSRSKLVPILVTVIVILVLIVIFGVSQYNSLVGISENVENERANIDTMLQRRVDLIPNLVETVKGYAAHEKEVIESVSEARSKLAGAGSMEEKAAADTELSGALSRLLMVVENYPDLKANTQFQTLSDELAGTENRIAVARKDYNDAVKIYNQKIRRFPSNLFAGMFGFDQAEYFTAQEGAEQAPNVSFD